MEIPAASMEHWPDNNERLSTINLEENREDKPLHEMAHLLIENAQPYLQVDLEKVCMRWDLAF